MNISTRQIGILGNKSSLPSWQAVQIARKMGGFTRKVEVECRSVEEAQLAARSGCDIIMLDNFQPKVNSGRGPDARQDHSGKTAPTRRKTTSCNFGTTSLFANPGCNREYIRSLPTEDATNDTTGLHKNATLKPFSCAKHLHMQRDRLGATSESCLAPLSESAPTDPVPPRRTCPRRCTS